MRHDEFNSINTDKETVKKKISELSTKIKQEKEEEWLCESYELDIAQLIIDYSIRHSIEIPLINYDLYSKRNKDDDDKEVDLKPFRRIKIDDAEKGKTEYDYFNDFLEAIGEHHMTNPRFTLHPDIRELAESWNVE